MNITLNKLCIPNAIIDWTKTHIFDQGGEDGVCATQLSQQCNGAGARQQRRLNQLI